MLGWGANGRFEAYVATAARASFDSLVLGVLFQDFDAAMLEYSAAIKRRRAIEHEKNGNENVQPVHWEDRTIT